MFRFDCTTNATIQVLESSSVIFFFEEYSLVPQIVFQKQNKKQNKRVVKLKYNTFIQKIAWTPKQSKYHIHINTRFSQR